MTTVRLFVTGTGTGVGKTVVSRALALALRAGGRRVVAIKPIETGCDPEPADAKCLAEACGHPSVADLDGLYRAAAPLAPYAVELTGGAAVCFDSLVETTRAAIANADDAIVEGAGGLLVPVDRTHTIADLAGALDLPLLIVTVDALGVLSHTLTAVEAAHARGLEVLGVALRPGAEPDESSANNLDILAERLDVRVLRFGRVSNEAESRREGERLRRELASG